MDKIGLKNTLSWMVLNYGIDVVLDEIIVEIRSRNLTTQLRQLIFDLEEALKTYRSYNK